MLGKFFVLVHVFFWANSQVLYMEQFTSICWNTTIQPICLTFYLLDFNFGLFLFFFLQWEKRSYSCWTRTIVYRMCFLTISESWRKFGPTQFSCFNVKLQILQHNQKFFDKCRIQLFILINNLCLMKHYFRMAFPKNCFRNKSKYLLCKQVNRKLIFIKNWTLLLNGP